MHPSDRLPRHRGRGRVRLSGRGQDCISVAFLRRGMVERWRSSGHGEGNTCLLEGTIYRLEFTFWVADPRCGPDTVDAPAEAFQYLLT